MYPQLRTEWNCIPPTNQQQMICITVERDKDWMWNDIMPIIFLGFSLSISFFIVVAALTLRKYYNGKK